MHRHLEESIEKVKNHENFHRAEADADGRKDPLRLWRIIASTHLINATGSDQLDKKEARKYYEKIRQGTNDRLRQNNYYRGAGKRLYRRSQ